MKDKTLPANHSGKTGGPCAGEAEVPLVGWGEQSSILSETLVVLDRDIGQLLRETAQAQVQCRNIQAQKVAETEKLLLSLLDVMDAFERVFKHIHSKRDTLNSQEKKRVGNFRTIYKMLGQILSDCGVSLIKHVEDGFDPHWHTPSDILVDPSKPDGTIVDILRTGYFWQGKVLRKAEVTVIRNSDD